MTVDFLPGAGPGPGGGGGGDGEDQSGQQPYFWVEMIDCYLELLNSEAILWFKLVLGFWIF